jgi:hypothetical protein
VWLFDLPRSRATVACRWRFSFSFADETQFNAFAKLTWEAGRKKSRCRFFASPAAPTNSVRSKTPEHLFDTLLGPRRLVIYEESRHSVGGGVSSALLGPNVTDLGANWIAARFIGLPFPRERWFVNNAGVVTKSTL